MKIKQALKEADCLIARLPSSNGDLAIKMAQEEGIPYAIEVVGCPLDSYWNYGSIAGKLVAPLAWLRTRQTVKNAPFALYVTKHFLQNRYPCSGITVNASNVEIPDPGPKVLDQRLSRSKPQIYKLGFIGFIGAKTKGLHILLKALGRVKNQLPPFTLEVLGNGDPIRWNSLITKLSLKDHVHILGTFPSGEPVFSWLDTVDLYIHPSFQEGLPRALIEAMSRGCPALASKAGGIPELLDAQYLHPPGDYKTLAKQISTLISDHAKMELASKNNFSKSFEYSTNNLSAVRSDFFSKWICSMK